MRANAFFLCVIETWKNINYSICKHNYWIWRRCKLYAHIIAQTRHNRITCCWNWERREREKKNVLTSTQNIALNCKQRSLTMALTKLFFVDYLSDYVVCMYAHLFLYKFNRFWTYVIVICARSFMLPRTITKSSLWITAIEATQKKRLNSTTIYAKRWFILEALFQELNTSI